MHPLAGSGGRLLNSRSPAAASTGAHLAAPRPDPHERPPGATPRPVHGPRPRTQKTNFLLRRLGIGIHGSSVSWCSSTKSASHRIKLTVPFPVLIPGVTCFIPQIGDQQDNADKK